MEILHTLRSKHGLIFLLVWLTTVGMLNGQDRVYEQEVLDEAGYITGIQFQLAEEYDKAIESYKKFILDYPRNGAGHYQLGLTYFAQGDAINAEESLLKAHNLEPDNIWYARALAESYSTVGAASKAGALLEQMIGSQPMDRDLYMDAAYYYFQSNKLDNAITLLNQYEQKFGPDEDVLYRKYLIYGKENDPLKAETIIKNLVQNYPNRQDYWKDWMDLLSAQDRTAELKQVMENYLEVYPNDKTIQNNLYRLAASAPATEVIGSDINLDAPLDVIIINIIPQLQQLAVDPSLKSQLLPTLQQLTVKYPGSPKAWSLLGDAHFLTAEYKSASEAYTKCLKLEKSYLSVWMNQLESLIRINDYTRAIEVAEASLDYFPNQAAIYLMAGYAAHLDKNRIAADQYLAQASLIAGRNKEIKSAANALLALNNPKDADKYWKKSAKDFPQGNPIIWDVSVDIYTHQGNTAAAASNQKKIPAGYDRLAYLNQLAATE